MNLAKKLVLRPLFVIFLGLITCYNSYSQRFLTSVDTSLFVIDTLRPLLKRFENLRITGYMQPQFQVAQSDGAQSYNGGNFSQFSRSRFMLRRARVKIDYFLTSKKKYPKALFAFQLDGTERGVVIKDIFVRLYETWKNNFSVMTGFFGRPFGYEVSLSSAFRETPERGRMSQILMPGERDLGAALVFEPQNKRHPLARFRWDAGFFNGQGNSGTTDFDSYKDFITRLTIKPHILGMTELSGGFSLLRGGWKNGTKYVYTTAVDANGRKIFQVDSSASNLGTSSPRHYYGTDVQLKLNHGWGETEARAEYWFGTQPGTAVSTTNPGTIPTSNGLPAPTYIRHFDGAFLLFLQNIINSRHQLMVKYDWYDPNIKVEGAELGAPGTNLTVGDLRYNTLGLGYQFHLNDQTRIILYYDIVRNERTNLTGYTSDLKDNIFTTRLHFRF